MTKKKASSVSVKTLLYLNKTKSNSTKDKSFPPLVRLVQQMRLYHFGLLWKPVTGVPLTRKTLTYTELSGQEEIVKWSKITRENIN